MSTRSSRISLAAIAVLTAIGVGFLSACGPGAPLAPEQDVALVPAAKKVKTPAVEEASAESDAAEQAASPLYEETVTAYVPLSGTDLTVTFPRYAEDGDVVVSKATFWVPHNSMTDGQGHEITMQVQSGTTLDDVQVLFGPSGLAFDPPATLWITLLGPITEEDVQQAAHIAGDGYIESIEVESIKKGNAKLLVTVRIPGFSRYSLGDGSFSPEAE